MSLHNATPLYIALLERGLVKAKYQQTINKLWTHQEAWSLIGGISQWISKNADFAFIIHHHETLPFVETIVNPTAETLNQINVSANNLILGIKTEIELNRPQNVDPKQIINWTPPEAKILTPGKIIKDRWYLEDLTQYIPEKTKQFYKFILDFTTHCQVITHADVDHISFLHESTIDGIVIAGGTPSNDDHQTSFDLTLSPGTYFLELFAWGFPGSFNLILQDNYVDEVERPYMYDDNGFDAFGNMSAPQQIDLADPAICTITADCVGCAFGTEILTNSYIQRNVDGQTEIINSFSEIMIEFPTPRRIRQIKMAGLESIGDRIQAGTIFLQGKNEISEPWSDITVLNDYIPPVGYGGNWLLNQTIPYDETMEFLFYRIFLGEQGQRWDGVTEIELYD
ncbi:hypothetical protein SAMN02746065_107161 [Desulfocicer vacuolatum DSM 3385]|uniref:Uncharacterized protein n=1 Tax=Desulfocicer vacuolatum DSM 3385 TaxID=1121400 RepID=A0A1W2B939_9BACT|nr:hypothetical protein [Desulfocicer vacuolatum]SMC69533.1 hypothetical protein SAMN02746065_107161 [Desulfocicer vacuolatum DSM 3385]